MLTLLLAGRELLCKLAPSESRGHGEEQKHLTPWRPTILLNKVVILGATRLVRCYSTSTAFVPAPCSVLDKIGHSQMNSY